MPAKLTFISERFRCNLQCRRCSKNKPEGGRCKNRVCNGVPMCWIHTAKDIGVRVRQSTLPGGGKGLFAEIPFPPDSWICPYVGQRVTKRCLTRRYGDDTAPYAISHNRLNIDSACMRGVGAFGNGKFRVDGTSQSINRHNAAIAYRNGSGLWLYSTRNIQPGREIFVWYGDDYVLQDGHITKRTSKTDNRPC